MKKNTHLLEIGKDLSKRLLWILGFILIGVVFITAILLGVDNYYQSKVYYGVKLGNMDLSGLDQATALKTLKNKQDKLLSGVTVVCSGKSLIIPPSEVNAVGAPVDYYWLDSEKAWKEILAVGRKNGWVQNWLKRFSLLFKPSVITWPIKYQAGAVEKKLRDNCGDLERPMLEADLKYENGWRVVPEQMGLVINYSKAVNEIYKSLSSGSLVSVVLSLQEKKPQIISADLQTLINNTDDLLPVNDLNLLGVENPILVKRTILRSWLGPVQDNGWKLTWRQDKIARYLMEKVITEVDKEVQAPRFQMADGRVTVFESATPGRRLLVEDSAQEIAKQLNNGSSTVSLKIEIINSVAEGDQAWLNGINEIIGIGTSSFAGSPVNRRHNIANGAKAVNGLVVKPGEEFSMMKTLGTIDASTGYLTELVIKENKTVPEYGGGLCQIGTTMFRAAVDSGLPITERRNHSYRVGYYEPAGTDATIYDPAPDLKFLNDTGNNILLITKVIGDKLRFEVWGTKDGRQVIHTYPTNYNIVKPAPTKTIETTELPVGTKKCSESAHNGADAYFDYKVTYPNGEVKEKRFSSHYVPWQAVCLVGVSSLSSSTPSSTTPIKSTVTSSLEL